VQLRLAGAAAGALLALAATALLAATGHLDGSSLLPSGSAVSEAVVLSVGGAAAGLVLGLARRR
jgi:membrane protease YdiL (CAAX protease family)